MVAPTLLWRYILREVLVYTLLGVVAIGLLFLTQHLLRFLEATLAAGVGLKGLLRLAPLILVSYFNFVVPTALVFGVLLGFGRMSADGEIVAMRASGVSVVRLLPPVVALGALAAATTGYLLFEVEPESRHQMKSLVREFASSMDLVEPGRFRRFGDSLIYIHERGPESCPLRGVLIGDLVPTSSSLDSNEGSYISAKCGAVGEDPDNAEAIALDLFAGSIHFSDSSPSRYRRIRFERLHTSVDLSSAGARKHASEFSYRDLLELDRQFAAGNGPALRGDEGREAVLTQIHRRPAFAVGTLLLALLAVPIGIQPLRTGRSAGALTALGLIGGYWLVFTVGELASTKGLVPAFVGMWTPNLLATALLVLLLRRTMRSDS